jgi:hypothetical protein
MLSGLKNGRVRLTPDGAVLSIGSPGPWDPLITGLMEIKPGYVPDTSYLLAWTK